MPISYLTRIVEFTATHRIRRADWTDQQNRAEFGKAAVDHGHRYQCRVTVQGRLEAEAGGVMSLAALDALLVEEVTGALAVYVWERLAARLPAGVTLHAVRVQEGPHIYSEYFGES